MRQTSTPRELWPGRIRPAMVGLCLILSLPAAGDWLVTLEGRLIETRGPWTIDGPTLTYTDVEGREQTLDLDEVDLEGSEETTALKAGKTYTPRQEAPEAEPAKRSAGDDGEPKIILYTTALCGLCTEARALLEELGVDFLVRDVTVDKEARREYLKKAGHGGGLPVIDVDGHLIFTYHPRVVRRKIREFLEREAAAVDPAEEAQPDEDPA